MRTLLEKLQSMGKPEIRKVQVYDFGDMVRNFAGDLAMRSISKNEPEGEIVDSSPKVKRALNTALDALDKLAKAIFDTETATIDVSPRVRGRLASEGLDEALSASGIRATLERAVEKARAYANTLSKSRFTRDRKSVV